MQSVINQVSLYTSNLTGGNGDQRKREPDHVYITNVVFNQDHSWFTVSTTEGFRLFNSDPVAQIKKIEPIPGLNRPGGVLFLCPLYRTKFIILVMAAEPTKVYVYDRLMHGSGAALASYDCRTRPILNIGISRRVIAITTDTDVFSICPDSIRELSRDTTNNPRGVLAVARNPPVGWSIAFPSTADGIVQIRSTIPPPSSFMVAQSSQGPLHLWALQAFDSGAIQTLAFNSSGSLLAVSNDSGTLVRVFRMFDGALLHELHRSQRVATISAIAFSPDDLILALSSSSGTVHLFELGSKRNGGGVAVKNYISDPARIVATNNNNSNSSNNNNPSNINNINSNINNNNNNNNNISSSFISSTSSSNNDIHNHHEHSTQHHQKTGFFGVLANKLAKDVFVPLSGAVANAVSRASDTMRTRLAGERSFAQVKVCLNEDSLLDVRDPELLSHFSSHSSVSPFCGPVIGFIAANNSSSSSQSNNNANSNSGLKSPSVSAGHSPVSLPLQQPASQPASQATLPSPVSPSDGYPWKLLVLTRAGVAFTIAVSPPDSLPLTSLEQNRRPSIDHTPASSAPPLNSTNNPNNPIHYGNFNNAHINNNNNSNSNSSIGANDRASSANNPSTSSSHIVSTMGSVLLNGVSHLGGFDVSGSVVIEDIVQWMATRPNYLPPTLNLQGEKKEIEIYQQEVVKDDGEEDWCTLE